MKQTLRHKRSFSSVKVTEKSRVPTLFAEGVDVGVELALRWMEQELASSEPSVNSFQTALDAIRHLFQQAQQSSFQTALAGTPRSRRRSSARARSVAAGC